MGTSDPTNATRLPNLDVLRGLAALVVLVGHAYGLGGRGVPLSADGLFDAVLMLSPIGVWLFFVMSGLVIGRPFVRAVVRGSALPVPGAYALRRVARIYPLYLVCALAVLAVVGADGAGPGALLAHLGLLHNLVPDRQAAFITVTWTLTLEILFYAAVPIIAALIMRRRRGRPLPADQLARWITWSALASIVWMFGAGALAGEMGRASLFGRQLLPAMWSAFCPGLLIATSLVASPDERAHSSILRAVERIRADASFAWLLGGGAAVIGFVSAFSQPDWGMTPYVWLFDAGRVAWAVAFGVLVARAIDAHRVPARTPRALEAMGTWSYGIYLIHGTLIAVMLAHPSLVPMPHGGFTAFIVHLVYLAGLTIPLSWLSWRLVEQPAMRVASRRSQPRPVPAVAP